jgi:4'-phosphopantetheinyl transferase
MTPSAETPRLVWVDLDQHAVRLPVYTDLLDADERIRALGYVFDEDRARFVISRAVLRITLADALRTAPAALRFDYTPQHKPILAWPREGRSLHFNVSHAGSFAVIALAWHRPVGVDIERMRTGIDYMQMAERVFSLRERRLLAGTDPAARAHVFFHVWTRKEAYIKARGFGLAIPLDSFDVALSPVSPQALLATRPDPGEVARWVVRGLPAPIGYAAAVASSTRVT